MKHCMVVDDSEVIRRVARFYLERMGYMVSEAQNGAEAVARAEIGMPDLILFDWHMPGTKAHSAIEQLRRIHGSRRPTIVYMTTENDDDDIEKAKSAGADDCLLKPFDRFAFEGKVNEIAIHG